MKKHILFLLSALFLVQTVWANPEPTKNTRETAKADAPMTAEVLAVFFTPPTGAAVD